MNWENLDFNRRALLRFGGAAGLTAAFISASPTARALSQAEATQLEAKALALQPPAFLLETAVPQQLSVEAGSQTSITAEQAIIGTSSLKWDFNGGAIRINSALDNPASRRAADDPSLLGSTSTFGMWIYNEKPRNDSITLEFGRDGRRDAWCDISLNFEGWRTVWIRLAKDLQGTPRRDMNCTRIVAPKGGPGRLYLDQVILNMSMRTDHPTRDLQVPFVNPEGDTAQNAHWLALVKYQQALEAAPLSPVTDPTLLEGLTDLKRRYVDSYLTNTAKVTDVTVATLSEQTAGLGIAERAAGGRITPIFTFQQAIFPPEISEDLAGLAASTPLRKVTDLMQDIAKAWYRASQGQKKTLGDLYIRAVLHMRKVGWAYGSCQGTIHHLGYSVRGYYDSVFLMQDVLRSEGLLDAVRSDIDWMVGLGRIFERPARQDGIADIFNTNVRGLLAAALLRDRAEEQAALVLALKKYLDLVLLPSPGLTGGIKPDGTGFHHGGFYPAYTSDGYAGLTPIVALMSGTGFQISTQAHEWLKKSVLMMRTYANKLQWALTVCNRHPTGTDSMKIQPFQWLLQAGSPDGTAALDREVGAAFLRLMPPAPNSVQKALANRLAAAGVAPEAPPAGNWTFNYGALSVHRRGNWSVTVRGHNRYLWSTEIYVADNIYGRYTTYGQMTIQSQGDPVNNLDSGYSQEGWDWARFPGTTAIRKPVENLFTDLGAGVESLVLTDSRFAGAGSIDGHNGVFAVDLHEAPVYDPSHRARKSVFFFDDRIVSIGTNIENNDRGNETATTLFQSHLSTKDEPSFFNSSEPLRHFPFVSPARTDNSGAQWLADGKGNGYFVPSGQRLALERTTQQSRDQSTGNPTSGDFATAWISHGVEPRNESYEYAVLVGRTPDETAQFAQDMAGEASPYTVHEASRKRHIVSDRDTGITGYAVFEGGNGIQNGVVESIDTPSLVLVRSAGNRLTLSVTDPDLRLYNGIDMSQYDGKGNYVGGVLPTDAEWSNQPSQQHTLLIRLRGAWQLPEAATGVAVEAGTAKTTLAVTTQHGLPVQFELSPA